MTSPKVRTLSRADELRLAAQQIAFGPLMFQAARLLRDFGILDAVGESPQGLSPNAIAATLELSHYGVRVLLEAGLAMGLVTFDGSPEGPYALTRLGRVVASDPVTRTNFDFVHHICYLPAALLEEALRDGRPAGLGVLSNGRTIYDVLGSLPEPARRSWFAFDHLYSDSAFGDALEILKQSRPTRILDVGGNTGRFAIRCASALDEVHVTILDLPGQLALAAPHLEATQLRERISLVPFDLLDEDRPFPPGQELIWMSQVLSCFSDDQVVGILRRARSALREGGSLFVLETLWDDQTSEAARYSLHASSVYFASAANGVSRMYHSDDLRNAISMAGLQVVATHRHLGIGHTLVQCRQA